MSSSSAGDRGAGVARRLLRRVGTELHPGEASTTLLIFGGFFLCLCFQYAVKAVRQATFVDSFGAVRLPLVYLLVALLSYPLVRLYGRLSDRLRPDRLVLLTASLTAGGLAAFWWLYGFPWPWVPFVFYLWITVVLALTLSQFWAFAASVFDPRQAKRLFGFLGAGGLLGSIAGGQTARLASQQAETRYALLAAAVSLLTAALLIRLARPRAPAGAAAAAAAPPTAGLGEAMRSRHMRLVAGVFALSIVVAQFVDIQFNWLVEHATTGLDRRTAFFGNFYSVMGAAAVIFQLLFTSRIQRGLGVGFALRVLPVTLSVGTVALLVASGFFPALVLAAGLALKTGENGIRYSLDQATRELLFLPVPAAMRAKAKAVIDVIVQRGAKGLAAVLLLPVAFGLLTPVQASWISLVLIGIWLALVPGVYREYVRAYRESLGRASAEEGLLIDLADVRTLEVVVESLGSSDTRQVLYSLQLLSDHGRGHLVPPLLLYHDDPRVRRATLKVLADCGREDAMPLIERRLSDQDPEVRAAAIGVLASLRHVDAGALMLPRLEEPNPAIRAAAIACIASLGDESLAARASAALRDMLSDEQPECRKEAARCLGAVSEPTFRDELVQLLYDPDTGVVREAIGSVRRRVGRDGFNSIYMPTLVSLLRSRHLKHDAREALIAFGEPVIPALVHFLNDPDEHLWVRRAIPKTLARIGTPIAAGALVANLGRQSDSFLRRKMIEALQSPTMARQAAADPVPIGAETRAEVSHYLQTLADLEALDGDAGPARAGQHLLSRLLSERLDDHLRNIFGLLAVLHPPEHIWAAYRSLSAPYSATRGHALEYLDNTLTGELRRTVFAVIEDQPLGDKLRAAERQFEVRRRRRTEALRGYLAEPGPGDADSAFLSAAALYRVYTDGQSELYPEVRRLAEAAAEPFVSETARWIARRLEAEPVLET